jgi:hypothetical protein
MAENTITTTRKGRFQLAKIIGTRYRFDLDPAYFHELAEEREPNRLWYERIPCAQEAVIVVQDIKPLVFKLWTPRVKNAKSIYQAIKNHPGFNEADFGFDGEATLTFTKEALPTVAEMARARKKRMLSPEQKERLSRQGIANLEKVRKRKVEDKKTTLI